jgi:iron uptake system component EfeO
VRKSLIVARSAALAATLAACGSPGPQQVTVTMRADACDVQPAGLSAGAASFAVLNETAHSVKFSITENSDEAVASVDVAPGATQHLDVTLDEDDEYHVQCGDVRGPDVQPGG